MDVYLVKTLFLSTYDTEGGAAKAAYRLFKGLQNVKLECYMLVMHKTTKDETVFKLNFLEEKLGKKRLSQNLDSLPTKLYPKRRNVKFSSGIIPEKIPKESIVKDSDLLHLHWISSGFLRVETLQHFCKPIVWTLHDMWAFTGGCHYDMGCEGYIKSCGKCPILGSSKTYDLSRWNWIRKYRSWKNLNLTLVTPSNWLADCVKKSPLFRDVPTKVIPNGLDAKIYQPYDKFEARKLLSLPQDKKLVLFGAHSLTENRKGMKFLLKALSILKNDEISKKINFVIFGAKKPEKFPNIGFKTHFLGRLNTDQALTLAYSAADVFVCPSIQENLANTVLESLACGTPCVSFNIGGMPDLIDQKKTGYLAQPFNVEDLSKGILWTLESDNRWKNMSDSSRAKFEREFKLSYIGKRYLNLYNELVSQ